jgi:hypothetical protein
MFLGLGYWIKHHCPIFCSRFPPHVSHGFRGHAGRNGWVDLSSFLSSGLEAGLVFERREKAPGK